MAIDYQERIPNNVDLASDRVLQRALEHWQPRFLDWWRDLGPTDFQAADVYLRTAVSVDRQGWATFGHVKMPEYRWGIFLAERDPDRRIGFGDEYGKPVWQQVPGELRSTFRRLIVTQGDTEPASVEQQRLLGHTAPSLYDLRGLFQVNVEEGRHLWAMVYLLHAYFGRDGREEAEELLCRHSGDVDKPRILGTFNEPISDWLSFFMFTFFTDRDGKYQLMSLAESGFDPLARTCQFMLTEEAHHMFIGHTGLARVTRRTLEVMAELGADDPEAVRRAGAIDLPTIQRYINFWFSSSLDLFGSEVLVERRALFRGRHQGPPEREPVRRPPGAVRDLAARGARRRRRRARRGRSDAQRDERRDPHGLRRGMPAVPRSLERPDRSVRASISAIACPASGSGAAIGVWAGVADRSRAAAPISRDAFEARTAGMAADRGGPRLHPQPDAAGAPSRERWRRGSRRRSAGSTTSPSTTNTYVRPDRETAWRRKLAWRMLAWRLAGRLSMADTGTTLAEEARARAYATPLEDFQVHAIDHFTSDTLWPWFERLRAEDPVHYTARERIRPLLVDHPLRRHRRLRERRGAALVLVRSMAASPCSSRRKAATRRSARRSGRTSSRSIRRAMTPSARWWRRSSPPLRWPSWSR